MLQAVNHILLSFTPTASSHSQQTDVHPRGQFGPVQVIGSAQLDIAQK